MHVLPIVTRGPAENVEALRQRLAELNARLGGG